jgi:hypothetical protein
MIKKLKKRPRPNKIIIITRRRGGARGSLVVKALGYKPEGRGFETP